MLPLAPSRPAQAHVTRSSSNTRLYLVATLFFSSLAIWKGCTTGTSDIQFKLYAGAAGVSLFLAFLSTAKIGNRIFRTAVLQEGVKNDSCFERTIITTYRKCNGFNDFNPARAMEAHVALGCINIKANTLQLDQPARELEYIEFSSQEFERTIQEAGGRWEKRGAQFVIVPPADQNTKTWRTFEKGIAKFHWPKEQGVIVTCNHADTIPEAHQKLFVYACNSHTIMNLRRAGFYLGCKQSVFNYSPSGCGRSTGVASEGQHYADTYALYMNKMRHFKPEHIWLTASCGNCPMVVFLKTQLSDVPVNLMVESPFADLEEDFIAPQGWIVHQFAKAHWEALSSPLPDQRVHETRYSIERMIAGRKFAGKVVIVTVANDQRLKPAVARNLERIFKDVCAQTLHVSFDAGGPNPHSERFLSYPDATRNILRFIA